MTERRRRSREVQDPRLSPSLSASHTGEALAPVLAAGPHAARKPYDPAAELEKREDDLDIDRSRPQTRRCRGKPTAAAGTREDRVGRNGEPCRWDGRILERVVDRIHELGEFSRDRTGTSAASSKSPPRRKPTAGSSTPSPAKTWLLKLKFRVDRGTFKRDELQSRIELKTLNELADLPIYGNEPRVKVQEPARPVAGGAKSASTRCDEIDTPRVLEVPRRRRRRLSAVHRQGGGQPRGHHAVEGARPEVALPPQGLSARQDGRLGRRSAGRAVRAAARTPRPAGSSSGTTSSSCIYLPSGSSEPWATILTKKPHALSLHLTGPKGKFGLGRLLELGADRELDDTRSDRDVVRLQFVAEEHLHRGELVKFLQEHLATLNGK